MSSSWTRWSGVAAMLGGALWIPYGIFENRPEAPAHGITRGLEGAGATRTPPLRHGRITRKLEDAVGGGAPAAKIVALEKGEVVVADVDELATGEPIAARSARTPRRRDRVANNLLDVLQVLAWGPIAGGAGRSPPQRPARQRVLTTLAPPVGVRARAAPAGRVHDVHRAARPVDQEPGADVADANPDHALPTAGEVGGDDVAGALDAGSEAGAGGAQTGELRLDAFGDVLDYTGLDQEILPLGPGLGVLPAPAGPFPYRHPYYRNFVSVCLGYSGIFLCFSVFCPHLPERSCHGADKDIEG